jgi:ABC-2 type transport system ATP-binding protein
VQTQGLALRRPSLDDVFLALTGHAAEEDGEPGGGKRGRRRGKRSGGSDAANEVSS